METKFCKSFLNSAKLNYFGKEEKIKIEEVKSRGI
jgi:hypothetical protein